VPKAKETTVKQKQFLKIAFKANGVRLCRAWVVSASTVAMMLIGQKATAQTYSGSETESLFGTLGQNNTGVTAADRSVACVPTSVVDGLMYLNNVYESASGGKSAFGDGTPTYTTVNSLATSMDTTASVGTYYGSEVTGLENYLSATGGDPSPKVAIAGGQYVSSLVGTGVPSGLSKVVDNTTPTAAFLASALNAKQSVTIWIQWGSYSGTTFKASGGVESVTLVSISSSGGSGTASFLDPWGTGTVSSTATASLQSNVKLSTVGGYLFLAASGSSNPTGTAGSAPYPAGDCPPPTGICGRIVADLSVCLVPEPSTYVAGVLLLLPFAVSAFRKFRGEKKNPEIIA
jgi:hypothetical protein